MYIYLFNLIILYISILFVHKLDSFENKKQNICHNSYHNTIYFQRDIISDSLYDTKIMKIISDYLKNDLKLYKKISHTSSLLFNIWLYISIYDFIINSNYSLLTGSLIGILIRSILKSTIYVDYPIDNFKLDLYNFAWCKCDIQYINILSISLNDHKGVYLFSEQIFFSLIWCVNSSFIYTNICQLNNLYHLIGLYVYIFAMMTNIYQILFIVISKLNYSIGVYFTVLIYVVVQYLIL